MNFKEYLLDFKEDWKRLLNLARSISSRQLQAELQEAGKCLRALIPLRYGKPLRIRDTGYFIGRTLTYRRFYQWYTPTKGTTVSDLTALEVMKEYPTELVSAVRRPIVGVMKQLVSLAAGIQYYELERYRYTFPSPITHIDYKPPRFKSWFNITEFEVDLRYPTAVTLYPPSLFISLESSSSLLLVHENYDFFIDCFLDIKRKLDKKRVKNKAIIAEMKKLVAPFRISKFL